jgi:uncharacterized RDD family membrane protein YckC
MVMLIAPYVFQDDGGLSAHIRGFTGVFVLFIYEPLCTSLGCTLGQKITGIRIRKHFLHAKISLPAAYLRTFLKVTLGFISFLTILYEEERDVHWFIGFSGAGAAVAFGVFFRRETNIPMDVPLATHAGRLQNHVFRQSR